MAAITPSPDVSPVSAATTNGHFPRDSFCLNLSTLPDPTSFVLKSALRSPHLLDSPNGLFSGPGGAGAGAGALSNPFKKRPRNMSQSSGTDREMSNDTPPATTTHGSVSASNGASSTGCANTTDGNGITNANITSTSAEPRPSTKKRPSTDAIDYPRRRATIAVCTCFLLLSRLTRVC